MATDSAIKSVSNTFTATTADTITLTQAWPAVEITNADGVNDMWARMDGTTAVALADNNIKIPAGTTKIIGVSMNSAGQHVVSVVGSGGAYTVEGVR